MGAVTGAEHRPRHVLCVLGAGLPLDRVDAVAREHGGDDFGLDREYSRAAADRRMHRAFEACLTNATFTAADWRAVDDHDTVAYVLSPPLSRSTAVEVSRRTLAVAAALLR